MMENVDGNENKNKAALNVYILSFVGFLLILFGICWQIRFGDCIISGKKNKTKCKKKYLTKKSELIANSFNFNSLQDIRESEKITSCPYKLRHSNGNEVFVDKIMWLKLQDNYLTRQSPLVSNGFHSFLPCNNQFWAKEDRLVPLKLKLQIHNIWATLNIFYWTDINFFNCKKFRIFYALKTRIKIKRIDFMMVTM